MKNIFSSIVVGLVFIIGIPVIAVAAGTWAPTDSMSTVRLAHTSTLLTNGKVLVASGQDGTDIISSVELYNPSTDQWEPTGSMNQGRVGHSATRLLDGRVLIAGGLANGAPVATAEIYDPSTGTWSSTGSMIEARMGHPATLLPSGKVLVTGGYLNFGILSSAEIYDPATGAWSTAGSMTTNRGGHTATLLPSGKVLIASGEGLFAPGYLLSAELYDPSTGLWVPTGPLQIGRSGANATLLPDGTVLIAGGFVGTSRIADAEIYDPVTGTWRETESMPVGREKHSQILLQSGKVLVAGGLGDSSSLANAELYDPATGTWTSTGSLGQARYGHTTDLLQDGRVLVAGGDNLDSNTNAHTILAGAELFTPEASTSSATTTQSYVPIQPTLNTVCPELAPTVTNLVFITHGWTDNVSSGGWVQQLADHIQAQLPNPSTWGVCTYDWGPSANTLLPFTAYSNAEPIGKRVGEKLATIPNISSIHFIAHSAGSNLIQTAAENVSSSSSSTAIHLTFLDAYDPSNNVRGYGRDSLNKNSVPRPGWWAEQYVDTRGEPILTHTNLTLLDSFNFDVTALDAFQDAKPTETQDEYLKRVHAWPHDWYSLTNISNFSKYGLPLSKERSAPHLPYDTLLPGKMCILFSNNGDCVPGQKQFTVTTSNYPFVAHMFQLQADDSLSISPTGTFGITDDVSAFLITGSPVWFTINATTTSPFNVITFDYQFTSALGAEGVLAVLVDGEPWFKADERVDGLVPQSVRDIPVGDLASGPHTIQFRLDPFSDIKSSIQIGNIKLGFLSQTTFTDNIAPTTTATVTGAQGLNGWYRATTTIALQAVDNQNGVGVQSTRYILDGSPLQMYSTTSPIVISVDGIHTLQFYSTDLFGNKEATTTLNIKVDKTAPEITISASTSTKDLIINGADAISGTTIVKTATTTLITDQAGNTTLLRFQKTFSGGQLTYAKLASIQYNTSASIPLPSAFLYVWNTPSVLVSQTVTANQDFLIEAAYNKTKDKTTIIVLKKKVPIQTTTIAGLKLVKLTTNKGVITYSW